MAYSIEYRFVGLDLDAHEFCIELRVPGSLEAHTGFSMAAWIPGSYMIRDFARNLTQIAARDANGPVALRKTDKQTWSVGRPTLDLTILYRVYALDLSVRSAYLDQERGYFNGTSVFLRLMREEPAHWSVQIDPPTDPRCTDWQIATTLPVRDVDARGFGVYAGIGYGRLIDHPVEIGRQSCATFEVGGVEHRICVSDGGRFDMARLCRDVQSICSEHAALFGDLPLERYAFLTLATADGYGGLEHADSTSLVCKRSDLPRHGLNKADKGYRQLLGLCSHEYFHLWNVKRIRPAVFMADDLACEVHTELLWAFEGITSYYDDLALARSGVIEQKDYLELLASTITRAIRTPGRARQSIAESSFDAWTKFYKQDENAPNAIVSYYAKGALVALGLDVTLRLQSADKLSLDDLMRRLWQRYGKAERGVPERAIELEVAELLQQPLDDFFAHYVYGTDELPLADWLGFLGIGYQTRPAQNSEDIGGYRAEPGSDTVPVDLGAGFEVQPAGLSLTRVLHGRAAHAAGLSPGDLLVAVDGQRVSASNLPDLLQRAVGDVLPVHFFRRDMLHSVMLRCMPAPGDTCELWLIEDERISAEIRHRRMQWFASNNKAGT